GLSSPEQILQHYNGQLPPDVELMEGDQRNQDNIVVGKQYYAVEKRRQVTGRDLSTAKPGRGNFNQPVVDFNLTADGAQKFGDLTAMHSTLTLPGIAGIILTIGMAVDANVLVFERIREEMHAGRTVRSAIEQGFGRAWTSVLDTHLTTLISAVFLFQFGTGPI